MTERTHTSLWLAGTTVAGGLIISAFSFGGALFAATLLSVSLPGWLWPTERGGLLAVGALGLLLAFALALLCVARWSAPPQLWMGALAASLLLAGRQVVGVAIDVKAFAPLAWRSMLDAEPFYDPLAALLALLGLPLVVGLACWLVSRRRAEQSGVLEANEALHA